MFALELIIEYIDDSEGLCISFVSAFPGTATACTLPLFITKKIFKIVFIVLFIALDVSKKLYEELAEGQNAEFEEERQEVTRINVDIIH